MAKHVCGKRLSVKHWAAISGQQWAAIWSVCLTFCATTLAYADDYDYSPTGPALPKKVYNLIKSYGIYRYQWTGTSLFNCQDFARKLERLFNQSVAKLSDSDPELAHYRAHTVVLGYAPTYQTYSEPVSIFGYKSSLRYDYDEHDWHAINVIEDTEAHSFYFVEPQWLSQNSISFGSNSMVQYYPNLPRMQVYVEPPTVGNVTIIVFDNFEKAVQLGWADHKSRNLPAGGIKIKAKYLRYDEIEAELKVDFSKLGCKLTHLTCNPDDRLENDSVIQFSTEEFCSFQSQNCLAKFRDEDSCPVDYPVVRNPGNPIGQLCQKKDESVREQHHRSN